MNRIEIRDFGPVQRAEIDMDKSFQVLIGVQASGKSTICKVVYFCQKTRDYTLDFLMDEQQFSSNHPNEYYSAYLKYLTKKFMGCFGKTTHMQKFQIYYEFNGYRLKIALNHDGYVRFNFSEGLKAKIERLIDDAADIYGKGVEIDGHENLLLGEIMMLSLMRRRLSSSLNDIFGNDAQIIYIPAGRSLLATMSEQLQDLSLADMDLKMQEFITKIRTTKTKFGSKIPEIVKDYTKTVSGQVKSGDLDQAYRLMKQILKADYASESDGEKIYFDERHWVKLMYGSSGQQEVLWILMLIFISILEKKKSFIVIEEPEAHLFPIAQKDVVRLIALLVNSTQSRVLITTHSPYILTSLNILLYSDRIEGAVKNGNEPVVQKNMRVSYRLFDAYKVEKTAASDRGNTTISLLDEDTHLIDTSYIDKVSEITNVEMDRLIDMELELSNVS